MRADRFLKNFTLYVTNREVIEKFCCLIWKNIKLYTFKLKEEI